MALGGLLTVVGTFGVGAALDRGEPMLLATWGLAVVGLFVFSLGLAARSDRLGRISEYGPLPVVHGVLGLLWSFVLGAVLGGWPRIVGWAASGQGVLFTALFLSLSAGTIAVALLGGGRAARLQPGFRGKGRLQAAGVVHVMAVAATLLPLALLAVGAQKSIESGYAFTNAIDEAMLSLRDREQLLLEWSGYVAAGLLLIDGVLRITLWFLLPLAFRRWFWAIFDTTFALAFLVVWIDPLATALVGTTFPLQPESDELAALVRPIIALAVTTIAAVRVFVRALPHVMNAIEKQGFLTLIASRHLRAKKSGFLATISGLSIATVAFSTAMLCAVLSVMGGFRNDLKEKILGNNAHIVVDAERGSFEGWDPLLERIRATSGVVGASPYVHGEVMVTSATNRAGAVFRGIDPQSIGQVTALEENLTRGRLRYLQQPELLLDLPPEERRTILPLEIRPGSDEDATGSLVQEIDEALGDDTHADEAIPERGADEVPAVRDDLSEFLREDAAEERARERAAPARDVLPGIIVGKELARTLRVFLGDEIDVVSPFGDLGPAGPMPKSRRFRVAGVFYSGMYEYDMKNVYVLLDVGQRYLGTGDAISGIEIKVDQVEQVRPVADEVRDGLGREGLRVRDWQELNSGLFGALALEKLAMFVTLGIAILIAGFCVFGTLTLMVQEKGREIGILFAMGTTKASVVSIFLIEGLLIGVYGAAIGLGLGYLITFVFEHFGIRVNPEVYYIDRLPVHVDPTEFALVGLIALGICAVATLFPAVLAGRVRPLDAIRHQ